MLAEQPIDVMLLGTDLGLTKEFYADKVGRAEDGRWGGRCGLCPVGVVRGPERKHDRDAAFMRESDG
jgi:hypothetical protein